MKKLVALALLVMLATAVQTNAQMKAGSMRPALELNFGGLGLGYGASFEYGITDKISARASANISSYKTGGDEWSLIPIDAVGVYNVDDSKYAMLGVTWTTFSVDPSSGKKESSSSFGVVAGGGYRYKLNDKISVNGEGKYRVITLESGAYKLSVAWYTVGAGFSYALN